MAEFGFSAKVGADVSGFQKGMQKAEKSLKSFADGINNLGKKGIVGSLANVSLAMSGVVTAFKTATKVVRDVAKAVGECTEAYKTQAIAERTLQTAVENNPYVTGESLSNLKKFASEMQKVTNYGDEQILQLESQLISLGRTEEETMNIIKVATDMASSGTMSLDTAISQLNATLNGNIGRLGQQNAELKGLSAEELKAGKAVEILGEKFKGLASVTIDTSKQLKNIKGDFKEAIGEFTLPSSDMWNKFWIGFYEKGIAVINQFNEYLDKTIIGAGIAEELVKGYKSINDERQKTLYLEDNIHALTESQLNALAKHLESIRNRNAEQEELLRKVNMEKEARIYLAKVYAEIDADEAERQKTLQAQLDIENDIAILKGQYLEKIAEQERKWKNIETVTGEVVDNEEKIKFYQDSLVEVMTQANGQITTNNQLYKDQIAIIQQLQAELKPKEEEKQTSDIWLKKIKEQAIERLEAEKEYYKQTVDLEKTTAIERFQVYKNYDDRILELRKELLMAEKETALESVKNYANAEEEKVRITLYYNNKLSDLIGEYATEMETEGETAGTSFAEGFSVVMVATKNVLNKVVDIVKKSISVIKSVIKGAMNIFQNLFKFDPSKALDNLLAFEDSVLTFFVETLPQLPYFFESALSSIATLVDTVLNTVDVKSVEKIVKDILGTFKKYIPRIIDGVLKLFDMLITPVSNALLQMMEQIVNSGIFTKISDFITETVFAGLPSFLKSLVVGLVKGLKSLINVIVELLPDLINAVLEVLDTLIGEVLPELLPSLLDAILSVIKAIVRAIPKLSGQLVKLVSAIIKALPPILTRLVPEIVGVVLEVLPQIIVEVIKAVGELLKNLATEDLLEIIFALGQLIIKVFAEVIAFIPNTIATFFKELKTTIENMSWEDIKSAFRKGWQSITWDFQEGWESAITAVETAFVNMGNGIKALVQAIWDKIIAIINKVKELANSLKSVGESVGDWFAGVGTTISTGVRNAGDWISDRWQGFTSLFRHANGTNNARRGLSLVGEAGPELVRFNGGEQVLNARNTQKAIEGISNRSSIFNVTFNNTQDTTAFAMMKQLKSYQRNLAFNGVL